MADQPSKTREFNWHEWFPWLILLRTVRVALMARVMALGALGLIATTLGWRAIGSVFPENSEVANDPVISEWRKAVDQWPWDKSLELSVKATVTSAADLFNWAAQGIPKAPVSLWQYLTRPFMEMFSGDLTAPGFFQLLLCCLWALFVWGIFGGAISRIAALKLTRDEAPGFVAALKFAVSKLSSYSLAPLIALAGAGVFAGQLLVLGWLMRLEVIAMLAGVAWGFVLLLGFLMAILLIGALVGWPLMWATVSVEGTDAFDALSRSYAYTYQRPWRLLWYVLFAGFLAAVSMFVVRLFAASAIELGNWSVEWGLDQQTMIDVVDSQKTPPAKASVAPPVVLPSAVVVATPGEEPITVAMTEEPEAEETVHSDAAPLGLPIRIAAWGVDRWKLLLNALAAGYQAGFLWASAVGVYLLLRRDIDGVEMNEVYSGPDDEFGMPSLTDDAATGVPEVAPREPAQRGDGGSEL
ncbi:MAG: hypothetical protein WD468_10715 [Pirellulales bacterium]